MVDSIRNSFKTKIQEKNVFGKRQDETIKELSIKKFIYRYFKKFGANILHNTI